MLCYIKSKTIGRETKPGKQKGVWLLLTFGPIFTGVFQNIFNVSELTLYQLFTTMMQEDNTSKVNKLYVA